MSQISSFPNSLKRAVFCDFDGTITAVETFVGMSKEFTPQLSAELTPQMYAKTLTLREGVRQLLESIPAARYPEIIEYARISAIRPGLSELVDFLDAEAVPFIVVSGGLRGMVEATLTEAGLLSRVTAIYAIDIDTKGEFLAVHSQFEAGNEMVSKVQVMAQHPAIEQVAIGDSVTDLNMALVAPVVFARDRLSQYLDEHNKPYLPWQDFFDVRHTLQQRWQAS
ncbi:MAG: HAD-IB family phosphatase [Coleofasciculaceae cyanobacterium]